jgi:histidinol phosphatase-like PHP family hydrolase
MRVMLDLNIFIAGLMDDLAALQASMYPRRAYERAARKIALLPERLHEKSTLPDVGKTAQCVIREVLATGASDTVNRAIDAGTQVAAVEARRARREGFLSLAIARQVLATPGSKAVGFKDYRGDFQMHSQWSDGSRSIAEMAIACADRGYTHMAVTDHTDGLKIARGLSAAGVAAQHREINEINAATEGQFRVIKGIEANILADGSLDAPVVRSGQGPVCEIVLAAPHSRLDSEDDQTSRLVKAVSTPGVHILAHPSGRKFGKRDGVRANWAAVFAAAVAHDVAIEVDGDPSRQDLSYSLIRQAHEAGCLIALDSDAHDTDELVFAEIALAHARLAGIPAARVINTWTTQKLLGWLDRT